ncbi:MAG TPA: hypothetical protein VKX49_04265 [Bryobacteraceae bacterium]|nr:hypothetical protein [Bryobacteraceae bacterium]
MIITILFEEFIKSGPVRARDPKFQFKAEHGQDFGEFCEAQFPGASVFKRIERSPADAGLLCQRALAKFEVLAARGHLIANGPEV